jgi:hypothetical protein
MSTMPIQKKKKLPPGSIIPDMEEVPMSEIQRVMDMQQGTLVRKAIEQGTFTSPADAAKNSMTITEKMLQDELKRREMMKKKK